MPLRKPPTVKEHIRIVAIGDFEYVACGGTHPSSSGQVGLLKIVDARPSKGKLRLSFVCGKRAFRDYRRVYDLAHAAAAELSTAVENLPGAGDGPACPFARGGAYGIRPAARTAAGKRALAAGKTPRARSRASAWWRRRWRRTCRSCAIWPRPSSARAAPSPCSPRRRGKAISSSSPARRTWGRTWARCSPPAPGSAAARARQAGFRAGRRPYRGAGSGPRAPARAIKDKDKGGGVHTNDGHTGFF